MSVSVPMPSDGTPVFRYQYSESIKGTPLHQYTYTRSRTTLAWHCPIKVRATLVPLLYLVCIAIAALACAEMAPDDGPAYGAELEGFG
ncbi:MULTISPECIES: hypothetical protein [Mycetohabitans]|uniref:hypothetical protein n=1 Tax=Mycetohabitans sp. B6 TaxID=2841843 RepID=UPI00138AF701|nr:hypothetical protein [Mycetohabitans sp. B6]